MAKPSLKAHWIDLLARIADAGSNGICLTPADRRAAEALRTRGLVDAREKTRYVGLDKPPAGPFTFHLLTNAGREWLVQHRENPTPSREFPAGWTQVAAGHLMHTHTGVKINRERGRWIVRRPLGPVTEEPKAYARVDEARTRAAAFVVAAHAINGQILDIEAATFDVVGRPETWPVGQVDDVFVAARHQAVRASGTRTGYDAQPTDRVIQIETGERGTYVTGGGKGDSDCSYVIFDGETKNTLVHSGDLVVIIEPRPVLAMQVTREPKHTDDLDLGGPDEPGGDYYLLVDNQRIGGTYWCSASDIPDGQKWASWGIAGYSLRHPDRETAERVQIQEYVTNPDLYDRLHAQWLAEEAAKQAAREAEWAAEEEARRVEREGADQPGHTIWFLPPYHYLTATRDEDVRAVRGWLEVHQLEYVSGADEIRVEQRAERKVIVVQQARFAGLSKKTETRVVTLTQDPPDVERTHRPDLIKLIETDGHYPTKFPLIDFGQSWACAGCTRTLGSAIEIVPWECPTFRKVREVGTARLALEAAERNVTAAEAATRVAALADRDTTPEDNRLRTAEITYVRRRLALDMLIRDPAQDAEVRFMMISSSVDDGSTWSPEHWLGVIPNERETASAQALRCAIERHLVTPPPAPEPDPWGQRRNPRAWRVEIFTDPMAGQPAGTWTNLTGPCQPSRHNAGTNPITYGAIRHDGFQVARACCAVCSHRVWRLAPGGKWVLEGDQLLSPSGRPDPYSDPRPDPDPTSKINGAMGPGPDGAGVSFGYRIETRTGRRWATVRVGNTPAIYRRDPAILWAAADTILGNARQALGLGSKDPVPGVRVRAWDRQSGLIRMATRRATRKGNQHA